MQLKVLEVSRLRETNGAAGKYFHDHPMFDQFWPWLEPYLVPKVHFQTDVIAIFLFTSSIGNPNRHNK